MNESDYYVFFSYSVGIGPKTFLKLLSKFKTAEKIYKAIRQELENAGLKGKI
jgi:excinuclease UvrABC nuclease subunit